MGRIKSEFSTPAKKSIKQPANVKHTWDQIMDMPDQTLLMKMDAIISKVLSLGVKMELLIRASQDRTKSLVSSFSCLRFRSRSLVLLFTTLE